MPRSPRPTSSARFLSGAKPIKDSNVGTGALVLGVIAIVFAAIPPIASFGFLVSIVGFFVGLRGIRRIDRHRKRAMWGFFLSLAAFVLSVIVVSVSTGTAEGHRGEASPIATTRAGAASTPSLEPTPSKESATGTTEPIAPTPTPASSSSAATSTSADSTALVALASLPVKGKAPATGYTRTADFGTAWLDVDHNGCDTRNDILDRDLTGVAKSGTCKVLTGTLVSPYTNNTISFVRGVETSTQVQIDHVVALENAWITGAQQLTLEQREALANDPENLFAVDQHSNEQKSSGDAATWLPANKAFRCTYIAHQVTVKAKYKLWVTTAERDAMQRVLSTCSTARINTPSSSASPSAAAVVPKVGAAQKPASAPAQPAPAPVAPAPSTVSYQNCDAVRAAGAAPIHAGDPGYSRKLDRDGDGIGCE